MYLCVVFKSNLLLRPPFVDQEGGLFNRSFLYDQQFPKDVMWTCDEWLIGFAAKTV